MATNIDERLRAVLEEPLRKIVGDVRMQFHQHVNHDLVAPAVDCARCARRVALPPFDYELVLEVLQERKRPEVSGYFAAREHGAIVAGDAFLVGELAQLVADVACGCIRDHLAMTAGPRPRPRPEFLVPEPLAPEVMRLIADARRELARLLDADPNPQPKPVSIEPVIIVYGETFAKDRSRGRYE